MAKRTAPQQDHIDRPAARPLVTSLWLRRADQGAVAGLILLALVAMAFYGWHQRGELIEIERAAPRRAHFQIDINSATWPEFAQLPDVGEILARRIVESRTTAGPFASPDDLRRVPGIGPRTLERIRPYLLPMPPLGPGDEP